MDHVFQPDLCCIGNLNDSLTYLINENLPPKKLSSDLKYVQQIVAQRSMPHTTPDAADISLIIKSIRNALGETGILCSDIGLHKQYAGLLSMTYSPNTFICSNVCGSFCFGLPAGLGAKLAKPKERVCIICGDGGFHSTSQDLETVVRYDIPIVIIVLKDNAFGLIKYYQLLEREDTFADSVEFGNVDFVKLAQANGMQATQVTNIPILEQTINAAFIQEKPYLIEIPVKYNYKL